MIISEILRRKEQERGSHVPVARYRQNDTVNYFVLYLGHSQIVARQENLFYNRKTSHPFQTIYKTRGNTMIDFTSELGIKAKETIESGFFIWLTTVNSKGAPQPRPVWFIWHQDAFLIYSEPHVHKVQHIRENPQVSLHFNTRDTHGEEDIIVFSGRAEIAPDLKPANLMTAYIKKYANGIAGLDSGNDPEKFAEKYSVAIRVVPTSLRGW